MKLVSFTRKNNFKNIQMSHGRILCSSILMNCKISNDPIDEMMRVECEFPRNFALP